MDASIRGDFPILQRTIAGRPIIYFDSAATTLKPWFVLDKEREYSLRYSANVHRGHHRLSEEASDAFETAREVVALQLNVPATCVVFTRNATEAIGMVAYGLRSLRPAKVALSTGEHHSNLVPWMRDYDVVWIDQRPDTPLDVETVDEMLKRERPLLLAFSAASNITGVVNPVREICAVAKARGVLTCVDASQAIPHRRIDVRAEGCDFLAFSGHKMLAPAGIGVLTGKQAMLERLVPMLIGGGTVETVTTSGFTLRRLPFRLEAGTPNISGAIALAAAFEYIGRIGYDRIAAHDELLGETLDRVLASMSGIRTVSCRDGERIPIVSLAFASRAVTPDQIAVSLSDSFSIMVRAGHFCAHPLVEQLGEREGLLRVSLYIYNTCNEVEVFHDALSLILRRCTSASALGIGRELH